MGLVTELPPCKAAEAALSERKGTLSIRRPSLRLVVAVSVAGVLALMIAASSSATRASGSRLVESKKGLLLFVREGFIYSVRADGSRVRRLTRGEDPAWSFDGTRFAYDALTPGECGGDCPKVFVAKADGTARRRATNVPPSSLVQLSPAWSPDGAQIVYSSSSLPVQSFGLAVATVGGSPRYITGDETTWDSAPAWSPDGGSICFTRDDGLYVVTPTGEGEHRIVERGGGEPAWSPDGRSILFAMTHGDLYTVTPDGTALLRIAPRTRSADWSPDGMRILVSDATGIFTVGTDGKVLRRLTRAKTDRNAVWSPGGTMIAFQRQADLWSMNADGSNKHLLVRHGARPAWQPRRP
jgi:Tol biopolymer transport system component